MMYRTPVAIARDAQRAATENDVKTAKVLGQYVQAITAVADLARGAKPGKPSTKPEEKTDVAQ